MDNIPDGDWYCHECMNKATGERNCIVCGKKQSTSKLVLCDLCPRAYHQECLQPPLTKVPRGKWYCPTCHSKQPKKRNSARRNHSKQPRDSESSEAPPASPAPSHSSVTTNEDSTTQLTIAPPPLQVTPNCVTVAAAAAAAAAATVATAIDVVTPLSPPQPIAIPNPVIITGTPPAPPPPPKKDKVSKKVIKELAPCKTLLEDLECHDDAWPFLLPVNTKQFPTYKKIIKSPMDLSTIKKRLHDMHYKSREDFCNDVRQIFNNCETFNEDDSPVGKAGHCMRQFFEARWNELCPPSAKS